MLLEVNAGRASAFLRRTMQLQGGEWLLQWGNDSGRMKAMREDSSFVIRSPIQYGPSTQRSMVLGGVPFLGQGVLQNARRQCHQCVCVHGNLAHVPETRVGHHWVCGWEEVAGEPLFSRCGRKMLAGRRWFSRLQPLDMSGGLGQSHDGALKRPASGREMCRESCERFCEWQK